MRLGSPTVQSPWSQIGRIWDSMGIFGRQWDYYGLSWVNKGFRRPLLAADSLHETDRLIGASSNGSAGELPVAYAASTTGILNEGIGAVFSPVCGGKTILPAQTGNWAYYRENGCQTACKPGSVRTAITARDDHSSGMPVAGHLARPTRATAREPAWLPKPPVAPTWSCSRWGLPCRVRHRPRGALLPHPFTLTFRRRGGGRRFAFCGTVPGVAPAGCYPAPRSRGARTFLSPAQGPESGRPAVWRDQYRLKD